MLHSEADHQNLTICDLVFDGIVSPFFQALRETLSRVEGELAAVRLELTTRDAELLGAKQAAAGKELHIVKARGAGSRLGSMAAKFIIEPLSYDRSR